MAFYNPGSIEKMLEDDEENGRSKNVSSSVQETGSSNLADLSPILTMFCKFLRTLKSLGF